MPVSQADIDRLNDAIATGARSVTLGDQTVIYNTGDTLIRMRDDLKQQLALLNPSGVQRPRQYQVYQGDRGYD